VKRRKRLIVIEPDPDRAEPDDNGIYYHWLAKFVFDDENTAKKIEQILLKFNKKTKTV